MMFSLSFRARMTAFNHRGVVCFRIRRCFVALAALVTFAAAALIPRLRYLIFEHLVHSHRLHVLSILSSVPSFHQVKLAAQLVNLILLLAHLCFQLRVFFLFLVQLLH